MEPGHRQLLPNHPVNRLLHRIHVGRQLQRRVGVAGDHVRQRPPVVAHLEPGELEAGGSATLAVTYDATVNRLSGKRRLDYEVNPTGQKLRITVDFAEPESTESAEPTQQ